MRKKTYRSFKEARKFVRNLKLSGKADWERYCKSGNKPDDIPTTSPRFYKKEWKGWGDFLGTGKMATFNREYRSFKDARKFVHGLNLKNGGQWTQYCKSGNKPDDIPNAANRIYKKEWKGMGDWLGTGYIANFYRKYRPFSDARKFAQSLKLSSGGQWTQYCKSGNKPDDIPTNPEQVYKNKGWTSWGDFLGTGKMATFNREYRSFKDARKFAQSLKLIRYGDWKDYCKSGNKPDDIPNAPDLKFKNKGWISWGDFLGTGKMATFNREYRSFKDARKFVHDLEIKSYTDWRRYCKSGNKPDDIPSAPNQVYKKEWKSLGDWLGHDRISDNEKFDNYLPWKEAKPIYRRLAIEYGLKNGSDWRKFAKSHRKLLDKLHLPQLPDRAYSKERVWRKMK